MSLLFNTKLESLMKNQSEMSEEENEQLSDTLMNLEKSLNYQKDRAKAAENENMLLIKAGDSVTLTHSGKEIVSCIIK